MKKLKGKAVNEFLRDEQRALRILANSTAVIFTIGFVAAVASILLLH